MTDPTGHLDTKKSKYFYSLKFYREGNHVVIILEDEQMEYQEVHNAIRECLKHIVLLEVQGAMRPSY